MFFDLVRRNSRRSRKENGLFFLSLLISIIAFYIILSLSQQDVMRFLKQMESDAVNRLLTILLPDASDCLFSGLLCQQISAGTTSS